MKWENYAHYQSIHTLLYLSTKSDLHLLGDFAVCCFDEAARVVDVAPDDIVGEVRLVHQVLWVHLELEFTQNLDLQCWEKISESLEIYI